MPRPKVTKEILDTHTFIWLMQGDTKQLSKSVLSQIEKFSKENELYISAISLWEIAMLETKDRIVLSEPCLLWLNQALAAPGLNLAHLSPEISVDSANLLATFHGDPADRIIVSTTRHLNAKLFTRDEKILKYAKAGYLEAESV